MTPEFRQQLNSSVKYGDSSSTQNLIIFTGILETPADELLSREFIYFLTSLDVKFENLKRLFGKFRTFLLLI